MGAGATSMLRTDKPNQRADAHFTMHLNFTGGISMGRRNHDGVTAVTCVELSSVKLSER